MCEPGLKRGAQEEVIMMILVYLVVGFDEVLTAPPSHDFGQRTN